MPLAVDNPDLNAMFGNSSILGGQLAMQRQDRANMNSDINQMGALQDLFHTEAMNPLKVQNQHLSNQRTQLELPGVEAESSLRQDKARVSRDTMDLQPKVARSELMKKITDNDVSHMKSLAQMLAYSPDPQLRKQGEEMMRMTEDVVKEREKQKYMMDRQVEIEQLRGKNALDLANVNNQAGRYATKGGKGGPKSIEDSVVSGKLNFEKAAVAFRVLSDNTDDPALAQQYAARADQYEVAAQKQRQAAGAGVQRPDLQGMNIPATPAGPQGSSFPPVGQPTAQPRADGYTGPGSSPTNPISGAMIKQAFGDFEPDKYDYRVNPQTGKVQRKLRSQ